MSLLTALFSLLLAASIAVALQPSDCTNAPYTIYDAVGDACVMNVTYGPLAGGYTFTGDVNDMVVVGSTLYTLYYSGAVVRQTGPATVSLWVGNMQSSPTSAEGVGSAARLAWPMAMDSTGDGSLLVTVRYGLMRINIETAAAALFAGSLTTYGAQNGAGNAARFASVLWLAVIDGWVLVSDEYNHALRVITNGASGFGGAPSSRVVSTYAGVLGVPGAADGAPAAARFSYPGPLRYKASAQKVAIVEHATGGHRLRFLSFQPSPMVSTVATLALPFHQLLRAEWDAAGERVFYFAVGVGNYIIGGPCYFGTLYPTEQLLVGSKTNTSWYYHYGVGLDALVGRVAGLRRFGSGFLVGSMYGLNVIGAPTLPW